MRLIDADAFIKFLKETSKKLEFDKIEFKDSSLTAQAIIDGVIADLDGTSLDGFENAPTIEPEPKWIPVTETLPKMKEVVLITNDKGNVTYGKYQGTFRNNNEWFWRHKTLQTVIAWMPTPEPYRGDE